MFPAGHAGQAPYCLCLHYSQIREEAVRICSPCLKWQLCPTQCRPFHQDSHSHMNLGELTSHPCHRKLHLFSKKMTSERDDLIKWSAGVVTGEWQALSATLVDMRAQAALVQRVWIGARRVAHKIEPLEAPILAHCGSTAAFHLSS